MWYVIVALVFLVLGAIGGALALANNKNAYAWLRAQLGKV